MKLLLWLLFVVTTAAKSCKGSSSVSRDDFPEYFVFGSGTSAYQSEGAAAEDGRTPSIWDTSAHRNAQGSGDITTDGYHKYKEDVQLMKETGLEGYRFSISWSRLIPGGRGKVNPKGLEYYNNFINELVSHGIEPHVTLLHFDSPQVLEDEYLGWLSPRIVEDFTAYANVCFREFGDRVSHWSTINEANIFALGGYDDGIFPPNRCSHLFNNCSHGNSVLEPYIVAHNLLLAHSSVASLYKNKYQPKQLGLIGLNLIVFFLLPLTNSTEDVTATKRAQEFYIGWFVDPLMKGDYPTTMREAAGKKMPRFSNMQSEQLRSSFDFIGVNYYMTMNVKDSPNNVSADQRDFMGDMSATVVDWEASLMLSFDAGDISKQGEVPQHVGMSPYGLQGVLEYFKQTYGNPPVYIHENGYPMPSNSSLEDTPRVENMKAHMGSLHDAIRNGSNVRGYFTWSFVDVFEIFGGYQSSFGLYRVDFEDKERTRYPKLSARWYSSFLKRCGNDIYSGSNSSLYVA